MNEIIGIFREEQDGKYASFSFRTITEADYQVVAKGKSCLASYPEAAFMVSYTPFVGSEKIKWQLNNREIIYTDRIVINIAMSTKIIYDVVSDMMVENAIIKEVDVLRIKIEKQSQTSISLLESGMQIVDTDDDYAFFEIDINKEVFFREEE